MSTFMYRFQNIPLFSMLGVNAAPVSGRAEVSYHDGGEWGVGRIWLDDVNGKSGAFEVEYSGSSRSMDDQIYLRIWDELEDGEHRIAINAEVRKRLPIVEAA